MRASEINHCQESKKRKSLSRNQTKMYRDDALNERLEKWFNIRKSSLTLCDLNRVMFWRLWLERNGFDYNAAEFKEYFFIAYQLIKEEN